MYQQGLADFAWGSPGDPNLLPHKAQVFLHEEDVVFYDRLVYPRISELPWKKLVSASLLWLSYINQLITNHVHKVS